MITISGVILYERDASAKSASEMATSMVEFVKATGAIPGIKVDKGITPLRVVGRAITQGPRWSARTLSRIIIDWGAALRQWRAVIGDFPS